MPKEGFVEPKVEGEEPKLFVVVGLLNAEGVDEKADAVGFEAAEVNAEVGLEGAGPPPRESSENAEAGMAPNGDEPKVLAGWPNAEDPLPKTDCPVLPNALCPPVFPKALCAVVFPNAEVCPVVVPNADD